LFLLSLSAHSLYSFPCFPFLLSLEVRQHLTSPLYLTPKRAL
jgi:hypothetical protein